MNPSTTVLMVIFFFLIIPLILAEFARAKAVPTLEDFFLQSRKMPAVMVFFTVYSTWISVFAFLGASSYFYAKGPVYMTTIAWDVLFGLLFMIIGLRIWQYGKARHYITPVDLFDDIFSYRPLSTLVTIVMFGFTIPYLQIQLSGGAYLIETATGGLIPREICGLIFYLIIIIYLWSGGLRAVAFADIFYGTFIFISMLTVGFFLISKSGGIEATFLRIYESSPENLTLPGPSGDAGPLLWISLFVTVPVGALMGPQIWIRFFAVEKRKTFNIIPLLICLVSIQCIGTALCGIAGIVLVPGIEQSDKIIPIMLLKYCAPILAAIFFCGIASAALSTANSQIHAASAMYTIDIHKRFINKNASEKQLVHVGKWAVLIISISAYVMLLNNPGLIIDTGTVALGGTAQIFPLTVGALFWHRSNAKAGTVGLLSGVALLLLFAFFVPLPASYGALLGLGLNSSIFIIGSLLLPENNKSKDKIMKYKIEYEKSK